MDVDLNGNNLTVGSIKVHESEDENKHTLTVVGAGRANLGTVIAKDGVIIGNEDKSATTVALDIVNSELGATGNTVKEGATLEVYGDSVESKTVNFTVDGTFKNTALFTDWVFEDGTIKHNGTRSQACMNDGFLAALSIHQRYTGYNMVRDRLISGGSGRSGYFGQAPCEPVCDPCGSFGKTVSRSAWVSYTGRSDTYRSSHNGQDWKTSMEGIQLGTDLYKTNRTQFGILFGYEGGRSYNAADRLEADDTYVGFYGARVFRGGVDGRIVFAYGGQEYDMGRVSTDTYLYTSSFKGHTTETNLELGKRYTSGAWSLRPVAGLDIMTNNLKAATETTGSVGTDAVAYDKTSLTQVFFRTGTDLRYTAKGFTINSGVYYAYDVNGADLKTGVSNVQDQSAGLAGTKLGRSLVTLNIGGDFQVSKCMSLFAGYQGQYVVDRAAGAQSIGYAGLGWKW